MSYPITIQPGAELPAPPGNVTWMAIPQNLDGCPKGLEYLSVLDEVQVKQELNLLETFTKFEAKNRYTILNKNNDKIFDVAEESNILFRQCCNSRRGYTMHIYDNFQQEVMTVDRPFKCCASEHTRCWACLPCHAQTSTVEAPPGKTIGRVRQRCACYSANFYVYDGDGNAVFSVEGPCDCCITCCPCIGKVFRITSIEGGREIGDITRRWQGYAAEYYTNLDTYVVKFPIDLDVRLKAALIGTVFLIDFMEFEKEPKKKKGGKGDGKVAPADT